MRKMLTMANIVHIIISDIDADSVYTIYSVFRNF